jgi:hypothetical protein
MKKICIIGDSHVSCMKNAWDKIKNDYSDITVVFFANPSEGLSNLKAYDGKLIATTDDLENVLSFTSGSKMPIDPSEYNIILIYGLQLSEYINDNNTIFYSRAVSTHAVMDHIHQSLSWAVLKQVRLVTDKLVYIGLKPLLSSSLPSREVTIPEYLQGLKKMNDIVFQQVNALLLSQPIETMENGIRTKEKFSKGSTRFLSPHSIERKHHHKNDPTHMNDDYGKLYLKMVLNLD